MIKDGYYHFSNDLEAYPEALCYMVYSMRGPGKTYSFLRYCVENKKKFIYMRRTNKSVHLICTGRKNPLLKKDPSPFAPLNRDFGWNILPTEIEDGIGVFFQCDEEENPEGERIGDLLSLNKVMDSKGSDFSDVDFICLDEFCPQTHEIVRKTEAEALLDFYMTATRDRANRGLPDIKLVLFSNTENISCPITREMETIDDMVYLNFNLDQTHLYKEERGLLLHHISLEEAPAAAKNIEAGIGKLMKGTKWADKALYGLFANNDFTYIKKLPMKHMKPYIELIYQRKRIFIYIREADGMFYASHVKNDQSIYFYDLDREASRNMYWVEHGRELQIECMEEHFIFENYSYYDLIMHFKEILKV